MEILTVILTGLTAGLHTSTWGMYKDSPHEGFTWPKYLRSTIASLIFAPIVWYFTDLDVTTATGIVLLWGSTYLCERLVMEVWKTFLRQEDQSKYFIPMQLHVLGRVVESKRDRYIAAFFYVGGIVLVTWVLIKLWGMHQAGELNLNPYIILLFLSIGGWISAFGGAWKDAPIEGFETFKFFRSPAVAYFWAWMAANLTDNFLVITMCGIGFTIASIETYKTFFFPSRPRGKFQGKPIDFPEMLKTRQKFIAVFVACWLFVIVAGVMAFMGEHSGLV
ncbi:MAG: hypothetical protein NXI23_23240 [Bacteroidetes bacterium]|jgi:hypothetical protein|nr:hypothetical protein [Bacteroidota bacterium]MDF1866704.1 hypothetical protein [Saprospiraceae bacterium]